MSATVISICPFPINEFKPGLIPSRFVIPAAKEGDIEILVIPDTIIARQRVPVLGNILNINVPATQVAESIVADRMTGQLLYSETSRPGLIWVPGEYSKIEAKTKFAKEIKALDAVQRQWYVDLIKLADDDWNRTHQHKFISDLQRYACKILGLNKEWTVGSVAGETDNRCVACYAPIHPNATICPTCKTNQAEFLAQQANKAAGVPTGKK